MNYRQFEQYVESCGLQAKNHGNGHWQVLGGSVVVNYWPQAKRGPKMHVCGTRNGQACPSVDHLIRAATSKPEKGQHKHPTGMNSNKRRRRRELLFRRDPHCHWCHRELSDPHEDATLDHKVPRSRGGNNGMDNVVLSCRECNQQRADNMPELERPPFSPEGETGTEALIDRCDEVLL